MSSSENSSTVPCTIEWIMSQPQFALGVADARAGRPHHPEFEKWDTNGQWNYERGRHWATLVPRTVALKRAGRLSAEAVRWFEQIDRDIL
jgi:hypothetical protein